MKKLEQALLFSTYGWYVFPIKPNKKTPPLVKWSKESSKNPEIIKRWWRKWPEANIGINCGKSKLTVIDLDIRPDKNGVQSFKEIEAEYKKLKDTRCAKTPSGGLHLYTKGLVKSSNGILGVGVDIKSHGGFVLAPGSSTEQGKYRWANRKKVVGLPSWLEDLIARSTTGIKEHTDEPVIELDQDNHIAWAINFLKNDARPAIQGDGGDVTTFKVVATLRERGLSQSKAEELILEYYNDRCVPCWDTDDLIKKVENAYNYSNLDAPGAMTAEAEFKDEKLPAMMPEIENPEIPSIFKEWVFITGQKIFLRKKDQFTLDVKSFDYSYNWMLDSGKMSKKIIRSKTLMQKYMTTCYEPNEPEIFGEKYNTWRPSGLKPKAGKVSWFLDHINYLADGREKEYDLILSYLAWCIQKPKKKLGFTLLIKSAQGVGKSWLASMMTAILGKHNVVEPSNDEIHGRFNSWAKSAQLCIIHELMAVGRKDLANRLKPMITDPTIRIEEKGRDLYTLNNRMNFLMFTNFDDAIPLEYDDRRYLVIFSKAIPRDPEYYAELFGHLKDADKVLHFLQNYDISTFLGHARAPRTKDKQIMQEAGFDDLDAYLMRLFREELYPFHSDLVSIVDVIDILPDRIKKISKRLENRVGLFIRTQAEGINLGQHRVGESQRKVLWSIRKQEIYQAMDKRLRSKYYWKVMNVPTERLPSEDF